MRGFRRVSQKVSGIAKCVLIVWSLLSSRCLLTISPRSTSIAREIKWKRPGLRHCGAHLYTTHISALLAFICLVCECQIDSRSVQLQDVVELNKGNSRLGPFPIGGATNRTLNKRQRNCNVAMTASVMTQEVNFFRRSILYYCLAVYLRY